MSLDVTGSNGSCNGSCDADRHRSVSGTNMNEHSSRSHLLVSVYITSKNLITNAVSRGKLHMVDLAGEGRHRPTHGA